MKKVNILLAAILLWSLNCLAQSASGDGPHFQMFIRGVMLINGNGAPPQGPIDIVVENNIFKNTGGGISRSGHKGR